MGMFSYGLRRSWHVTVRNGFAHIKAENLTGVYCPSHRSDVAFVESLTLELDHTIKTR